MSADTALPAAAPLAAPARGAWHIACAIAFAVMGVMLPYSTAGVSIALLALLLLALARPRAFLAQRSWRQPVVAAGLLLLAYIALHTLIVSGAGADAVGAVNRYHELFFLALLVPLLRDARHRTILLNAMLLGGAGWAAAMWFDWAFPALGGNLESKRISAGFVLAALAYLALMRSMRMANPWPFRVYALLLAATVLVPLGGRTGHVIVIVLAACAAWVKSSPKWRWPALMGVPIAVVAIAFASPGVNSRFQETLQASGGWTADGPQTSTAVRIELARLAWDLARKHAVTGAGYANYSREHQAAAVARYASDPARQGFQRGPWFKGGNPHNEYANQLIGGGVVALALFLVWLGLILREARRMGGTNGAALAGITLAFAVGALFNSMLMDFIEGHTFMALLALLLAEGLYGPSQAIAEAPAA